MDKTQILKQLKGGLIVSCQALENEPLHSSYIMGRMALAAKEGGAVGIRANTAQDIMEIKKTVELPVIGIVKRDYPGSSVYITPTMKEVDELCSGGVEIIATDATFQERPDGINIKQFIKSIKEKYPKVLIMADVSTYEEGVAAEETGFDIVATTLSGYTSYTEPKDGPDFELLERLAGQLKIPLIVEGRINTPDDAYKAIQLGAWAVVVGGAITRPQQITKKFTNKLKAIM